MFLRPHRDVLFEVRVVLVSSGEYAPQEVYVGMGAKLIFQSADLIPRYGLPTEIGDGSLLITLEQLFFEGGGI